MGEVVKFDASKFAATVITNMKRAASTRVGFLKMGKDGAWSYGSDETEVTEDDHVFVNPNGFVHGWQCWADTDLAGVQSELLGDVIAGMDQPLPDRPAKVPENGRPWGEVRGMSVLLAGEKLVYSTTSVGGLNAFAALAEEYLAQYHRDPEKMIAEVSLSSDSYKHKNKTYGRIYTPVFTIVKWHKDLPAVAAEKPAPVAPAKKPAGKKVAAKQPAKARRAS
jgi:hypothetical protein